MKHISYVTICGIIFLLQFIIFLQPVSAIEYTVAPMGGDFSSIQLAVTHATVGDTISVQSGTYHEKVTIGKTLKLVGFDTGEGLPIIEPARKDIAVDITASKSTVSGFIIQNAEIQSGIRISSEGNSITQNTIKGCGDGIFLISANNNQISGNYFTQNMRTGVTLKESSNNHIEDNSITKNSIGIVLDENSNSNTIFRNNIENIKNVQSKSFTSNWDSNTVLSYQYQGKERTSHLGNFWSDYRGNDFNGDGVGQSPYIVSSGATKRALLTANQNILDSYPLMVPKEFYTQVSEISISIKPQSTLLSTAIPALKSSNFSVTNNPSNISPISLFKQGDWFSPTMTATLFFFCTCIAAFGIVIFLREIDLKETNEYKLKIVLNHSTFLEYIYAFIGITLAFLSITFTIFLSEVQIINTILIIYAWFLCGLCIYVCISSFTIVYGIFKSEVYPLILSLHGIISAITVPGFGFFIILRPSGRIIGLFIFILLLSISAVISFWQYRKQKGILLSKQTTRHEKTNISAITKPVTTQPASIINVSDKPDVHQLSSDQLSYFPRELENKYYSMSCIGRGGIARVYAANRKSDGKKVAVKVPINFDEITGKSFLNEIKVWEKLRHPNIVEVSAVNILPIPYVEMEYVSGSLETVLKPIPIWKAVYIVHGIANALRYAHSLGIIHRDIKPHNILVTDDLTPKVTDWGMSKLLATDTKKSSIAGFSLSYAAPEQVSPSEYGKTDERTDIYQVGVLFYELVTGSIPFGGESFIDIGNAILHESPTPPSDYNEDSIVVEKIILKCIEKAPVNRYQSAEELLNALDSYLDEPDS